MFGVFFIRRTVASSCVLYDRALPQPVSVMALSFCFHVREDASHIIATTYLHGGDWNGVLKSMSVILINHLAGGVEGQPRESQPSRTCRSWSSSSRRLAAWSQQSGFQDYKRLSLRIRPPFLSGGFLGGLNDNSLTILDRELSHNAQTKAFGAVRHLHVPSLHHFDSITGTAVCLLRPPSRYACLPTDRHTAWPDK